MSNATFSWLHISDIHCGHGDSAHQVDQERVIEGMLADIDAVLHAEAATLRPDELRVIVISGDLAYSGAAVNPDEYTRLRRQLIQPLRKRFAKAEFFIVPGNHDARRSVAKKSPAEWSLLNAIRAGHVRLDDVYSSNDPTARDILRHRFKSFDSFVSSMRGKARRIPRNATQLPLSSCPSEFVTETYKFAQGKKVRFIGWNTALLANDELDNGRLRIPNSWVKETTSASPDTINILVTHHPLDWLADGVRTLERIRRHVDIHMHGHVHEAAMHVIETSSGASVLTLCAGACHEDELPDGIRDSQFARRLEQHGYSFGCIERLDDGRHAVRAWPRRWNGHRDEFLPDQVLLPPHEYSALMPLVRHSKNVASARRFENEEGVNYLAERARRATKSILQCSVVPAGYTVNDEVRYAFNDAIENAVGRRVKYSAVYAPSDDPVRRKRIERLLLHDNADMRTLPKTNTTGVTNFFVFDDMETVLVANSTKNAEKKSDGYFIALEDEPIAASYTDQFQQLMRRAKRIPRRATAS